MQTDRVMLTISELKIVSARHILTEAGIDSFVLNKTDSAYVGMWGNIQLLVPHDKADEAKRLLQEAELLND